jgi:hypothetical protein
MRDLVMRLLMDGGCALEDDSSPVWSLEEIRLDSTADKSFRA